MENEKTNLAYHFGIGEGIVGFLINYVHETQVLTDAGIGKLQMALAKTFAYLLVKGAGAFRQIFEEELSKAGLNLWELRENICNFDSIIHAVDNMLRVAKTIKYTDVYEN